MKYLKKLIKVLVIILITIICLFFTFPLINHFIRWIRPTLNDWRCVYAIHAVKVGDAVTIHKLIKNNPKTVNYCEYYRKRSILSIAILNHRIQIARELLAHGANPNWIDRYLGFSPLHYAVGMQDRDAVILLLHYKANTNIQALSGATPIMVSVQGDDIKMTKLLLDNHADINLRNYGGETPLYNASFHGSSAIVHLLLASGADVHAKEDLNGESPLFVAAKNGRVDIIRLLLKYGANA